MDTAAAWYHTRRNRPELRAEDQAKKQLTLGSSSSDMRRPSAGRTRAAGDMAAAGERSAGAPAIGEKASAGAATAARRQPRTNMIRGRR